MSDTTTTQGDTATSPNPGSPLYDSSNRITGYTGGSQGTTGTGYNPAAGLPPPDAGLPPVSQTQDASKINDQMSGSTAAVVFPPPPGNPAANATSSNTSVANPIPSAADIIGQGNSQTPGEKTNQTLLQKLAGLIGSNQGKTTLTNASEAAAGVPALTKTVNDLNTRLEGLNNQATDLQNQAMPGGSIENTEQQNALGRGVTAGGLAPLTAADLRTNQIKQAAIASQALTLKSAIYGAQGQLTLAKDAADKAADAQYEQQQQQVDYTKALIDANTPQMTKEEKNQALLVQSQLQDRQNQIDQAKEDKKTIVALAITALTNNPNDTAAHYAAQQALAESNKEQPNLQTALGLIGKYQKDPIATAKEIAELQNTRMDTAYKSAQMAELNSPVGSSKQQDALEQQYRTVLEKPLSNRSGGLGLEDQKVDQGVHLANLFKQYYDPSTGNYNIPPAQYQELTMGLARMISPTGVVSEGLTKDITQATAAGNIGKALTFVTGTPFNGNTQAVIKNLAESIDRQAQTAQQNRQTYMTYLQNLAPTSLDPTRKAALEKGELVQYTPIVQNTSSTAFASTPPNYSADLAAAKAAIAAGADPAQVKARMLTKYKQVDL